MNANKEEFITDYAQLMDLATAFHVKYSTMENQEEMNSWVEEFLSEKNEQNNLDLM